MSKKTNKRLIDLAKRLEQEGDTAGSAICLDAIDEINHLNQEIAYTEDGPYKVAGLPCITLCQPWATLTVLGVKSIETRSWPAPKHWIGQRIGIHASSYPGNDWFGGEGWSYEAATRRLDQSNENGSIREPILVSLGGIVGTAELIDCVRVENLVNIAKELEYGNFSEGQWAWLLSWQEPTTERCPRCLGRGSVDTWRHLGFPTEVAPGPRGVPCPICDGAGRCYFPPSLSDLGGKTYE